MRYTICVTDKAGNVEIKKIDNAHPKANPGPGCKLPPCDIPKSSGTPAAYTGLYPGVLSYSYDFQAVVMGDLNNDGALDLVYSVGANGTAAPIRYALNDGGASEGTFTYPDVNVEADDVNTSSLLLADFIGDGILDLVGSDKIYLGTINDGTFSFLAPTTISCSGSMAAADLDGDGKLDLICSWTETIVNWGDGSGGFPSSTSLGNATDDTPTSKSIAVGDLNGDGRLDVVDGSTLSAISFGNRITAGAASGSAFSEMTEVNSEAASIFGGDVGDLNGDGLLDYVAAFNGSSGSIKLYFSTAP